MTSATVGLQKDSNMPGKLDEISFALGRIQSSIEAIAGRAKDDSANRDREHEQNQGAISHLDAMLAERNHQFETYTQKTDRRIAALEMLQPVVTGLQMTRTKLSTLATVGFAVVVILGWMVEAALKWSVAWSLAHFNFK